MLSKLFVFTFAAIAFMATAHGRPADPNGKRLVGYCFADTACTQGKSDLRVNADGDAFIVEIPGTQPCKGFVASLSSAGSICGDSCADCESFIPAGTCYKTSDGSNWLEWCQ